MTVIIPKFQIHEKTHPGKVTLKVNDLQNEINFYVNTIGLTLFLSEDNRAILGVGKRELVELKKIANGQKSTNKTGLYHMAFLLPERKDLGNVLYHYFLLMHPSLVRLIMDIVKHFILKILKETGLKFIEINQENNGIFAKTVKL